MLKETMFKINKKGFTLVELLVVLSMASGIFLILTSSMIFFVNQIKANLEKSNILTQLNLTLEDLKMRAVSAVDVKTGFNLAGEEKNELIFKGENDVFAVSPDDLTSKVWYKYYVNSAKQLVLKNCGNSSDCTEGAEEVLVEEKFNPLLKFIYTSGSAPNLLVVNVIAQNNKVPLGTDKTITREAGVRFWFIDIAK